MFLPVSNRKTVNAVESPIIRMKLQPMMSAAVRCN